MNKIAHTITTTFARITIIRTLTLGLALSVCIEAIRPTHARAELTEDQIGVAVFLTSTGLLSYYKDAAARHRITQKIAECTNTDAEDLVDATTLGLYYWMWSYILSTHNYAFSWRYDSIAIPAIQTLSTSNAWLKILKKLPLLNRLACDNTECEGICHECEYKHLVRKLPFDFANAAIEVPLKEWHTRSYVKKANKAIDEHNDKKRKEYEQEKAKLPETHKAALAAYATSTGECHMCCEDNVQLISLCAAHPDHHACAACSLEWLNTKPPSEQYNPNYKSSCAICRERLIDPKLPIPTVPTLANTIDEKLLLEEPEDIIYSTIGKLGVTGPLWAMMRKNNLFPYRWAMAIYRLNPFIARHMTCRNESCEGICNQCKLKKTFTPVSAPHAVIGYLLKRML